LGDCFSWVFFWKSQKFDIFFATFISQKIMYNFDIKCDGLNM
jgi:hypothetical protein